MSGNRPAVRLPCRRGSGHGSGRGGRVRSARLPIAGGLGGGQREAVRPPVASSRRPTRHHRRPRGGAGLQTAEQADATPAAAAVLRRASAAAGEQPPGEALRHLHPLPQLYRVQSVIAEVVPADALRHAPEVAGQGDPICIGCRVQVRPQPGVGRQPRQHLALSSRRMKLPQVRVMPAAAVLNRLVEVQERGGGGELEAAPDAPGDAAQRRFKLKVGTHGWNAVAVDPAAKQPRRRLCRAPVPAGPVRQCTTDPGSACQSRKGHAVTRKTMKSMHQHRQMAGIMGRAAFIGASRQRMPPHKKRTRRLRERRVRIISGWALPAGLSSPRLRRRRLHCLHRRRSLRRLRRRRRLHCRALRSGDPLPRAATNR